VIQTVAGSVETRPTALSRKGQHQLVIIGLAQRLPLADVHNALAGLGFRQAAETATGLGRAASLD
jgi:hypothetical protein